MTASLSHSLIQWVSMSLIGLSGTAKTDISSWSCGNAVIKMGNQFARSEYLKLSRGSNFKPNRWIYKHQRISWMAVYFPELCVCWIIENYDFSNYNAVFFSQANDGIGHNSSNFKFFLIVDIHSHCCVVVSGMSNTCDLPESSPIKTKYRIWGEAEKTKQNLFNFQVK